MSTINWIPLTSTEQIDAIKEQSAVTPQLIFKHSIRCATSAMAKNRLERTAAPEGVDFYYLDLINYRDVSDKVARDFGITHESPQILLIRNGKCIFEESHIGIRMEDIASKAA